MAESEKKEPTLEEKVEALTNELAAERNARTKEAEKAQVLERTLAALGSGRQPAQPSAGAASANTLPPLSPDAINRLKAQLGSDWTDDEVRRHYAMIAPYIAELAGPVVQQIAGVLYNLGDRVDYHEVELTDTDFKKYKPEVEAERKARQERGEPPIARKELTQIVKARHFADEVKTASEAAMAAEKERLAAAGSAVTEGATAGGVRKAEPGAQAAGKITKLEDVDKIEKRADRVKAIEDQLENTPIP